MSDYSKWNKNYTLLEWGNELNANIVGSSSRIRGGTSLSAATDALNNPAGEAYPADLVRAVKGEAGPRQDQYLFGGIFKRLIKIGGKLIPIPGASFATDFAVDAIDSVSGKPKPAGFFDSITGGLEGFSKSFAVSILGILVIIAGLAFIALAGSQAYAAVQTGDAQGALGALGLSKKGKK